METLEMWALWRESGNPPRGLMVPCGLAPALLPQPLGEPRPCLWVTSGHRHSLGLGQRQCAHFTGGECARVGDPCPETR